MKKIAWRENIFARSGSANGQAEKGGVITLDVPPEESHSKLPTYRPALAQVLTGPACVPDLLSTTWEEGNEKLVIDDGGHKKTATTDSFLICKHFGGIITVVTSGQEQEPPPLEKPRKNQKKSPQMTC